MYNLLQGGSLCLSLYVGSRIRLGWFLPWKPHNIVLCLPGRRVEGLLFGMEYVAMETWREEDRWTHDYSYFPQEGLVRGPKDRELGVIGHVCFLDLAKNPRLKCFRNFGRCSYIHVT